VAPIEFGWIAVKLGRLEEAEPLFRESLEFDTRFAQAHYQLGVLLEKQDKIASVV